jgi:hypothetical protein
MQHPLAVSDCLPEIFALTLTPHAAPVAKRLYAVPSKTK